MPGPYQATGKQVLRDNAHFLDASTPEIAAALALLLNHARVAVCPGLPVEEIERMKEVLWS
ncbi:MULTISPECIES: hypothetical protein [unclassified Novosphingobium]|uniref:hypothetical protein n=1 Tax=unclassified Novosphingobium TaxID=2644732 RepID=UPI000D2FCD00|nr:MULTISPECIES: hypothetical protein [unclassified Novosphingobium]PTR05382.1 hypothetical protein C8K11_1349 [Novosphingobium sp. GV055]PUA93946.1 hypothetical protein C8K12_1349 [Novosphingobium sp. GV061]PUB11363.1 hypothetical protein C8K14_1349 [Novosphingobium sp. GV079]PUB37053.1 hypothetical protein C8K10_1349 [Novosphingobium sp. GV027]